MKEKIRAAVIGAGMIARAAHIPALLSAGESVELVAVCDRESRVRRYWPDGPSGARAKTASPNSSSKRRCAKPWISSSYL